MALLSCIPPPSRSRAAFLSLPTQSYPRINELELRQCLEGTSCCTRAKLTHNRAQGSSVHCAHPPPFIRASASRLGQSVREKPREAPTRCQARRRRPCSEMMLPSRKAASRSYQPVNPAASDLSSIIFSQVLLNTFTPCDAWYLQPGFRDSPELMDSTPLSNLAQ